MMEPPVFLLVPGPLDLRSGGYEYDRRIVAGLRALGWPVTVCELDPGFPFPTAAARDHARAVLAALPDGAMVLFDGLALGTLPDEVAGEAERLAIVALVHHPLAAESGLDSGTAAALSESERRALLTVRCVVVTSRATAAALPQYGVPLERIEVVEPGTEPAPLARGSGSGSVQLLCVANLIPRKGHERLVRALAAVGGAPWRLTCVGSLELHPATVDRVRELVDSLGLTGRVQLTGVMGPDDIPSQYDRADLFVLPTYHEGYGMVIAEALARGLPVVATATGAIPELLGGDAGLVVDVADDQGFAAALSRAVCDAAVRERMAAAARRVRDRLPTWDIAAGRMAAALRKAARG